MLEYAFVLSHCTVQNHLAKHPPTLKVFFATEMWERYGFYVVQTLLALYLSLHFHWLDNRVYALVGSFTALTYLSPIIGGWIADHLLGQKRTILLGALVLCLSYLTITWGSSTHALITSLAGIAVGTGLLKPNISSLLGNVYPLKSPYREQGFTIFYMGITTGIILGTTIPSYLNHYLGWSSAFLSASIGLVIAIVTFSYGIQHYHIEDYNPFEYTLRKVITAALLLIFMWSASFYILKYPFIANSVFTAIVFISIIYLVKTAKTEPSIQSRKTYVIGLLCLISVMFWAFYFQMFLSLSLFIVRVVKPTLFGFPFTVPLYVSIQSIGMILLGLLITRKNYKNPISSEKRGILTGRKFIFAMIFTTLSYLLIYIASHATLSSPARLSPLYIIPAYLCFSVAELLLSPVGLAAITVLANPRKVSTMMGMFFVSLGIGAFLSGKLALITAIPPGEVSVVTLKAHYASSFTKLLYILMGGTVLCFFINWIIKYLMSSLPTETTIKHV